MSTRLGTEATVVHSRKELADPASRISTHVASLVDHGRLHGALRIPNTVGALDLVVDLRARQVICSVDVDAPKEDGRPTTKINWLVRQLKQANEKARLIKAALCAAPRVLASLRAAPRLAGKHVRNLDSRLLGPVFTDRAVRNAPACAP